MLIEIQMQTSHKMQLGAYILLGLGAFEIGGGSLRRTNYLDWNSLFAIASIKDSACLVMYICKPHITTWLWWRAIANYVDPIAYHPEVLKLHLVLTYDSLPPFISCAYIIRTKPQMWLFIYWERRFTSLFIHI